MAKSKSDIFCPNCGSGNQIEQNFCRFCGLNLRETAKSLLAQLSVDEEAREFKRLRRVKRLTNAASIGLWIAIAAGALFYIHAVLTRMVLSGERIVFGLFLIFMVLQFVLSRYKKMRRSISREAEEAKTGPLSQNELGAKETTKLPEADFSEIVPALITENTTRNLSFENKTRKPE